MAMVGVTVVGCCCDPLVEAEYGHDVAVAVALYVCQCNEAGVTCTFLHALCVAGAFDLTGEATSPRPVA